MFYTNISLNTSTPGYLDHRGLCQGTQCPPKIKTCWDHNIFGEVSIGPQFFIDRTLNVLLELLPTVHINKTHIHANNARNHDYGTNNKTNYIQTLPVNQSHDNTIVRVSVLQVWLPYAGKLGHLVLIAGNGEKEYGWIGSIIDLVLTLTAAS